MFDSLKAATLSVALCLVPLAGQAAGLGLEFRPAAAAETFEARAATFTDLIYSEFGGTGELTGLFLPSRTSARTLDFTLGFDLADPGATSSLTGGFTIFDGAGLPHVSGDLVALADDGAIIEAGFGNIVDSTGAVPGTYLAHIDIPGLGSDPFAALDPGVGLYEADVTVGPAVIPLPATLPLAAAGLAGLAALGARRRR